MSLLCVGVGGPVVTPSTRRWIDPAVDAASRSCAADRCRVATGADRLLDETPVPDISATHPMATTTAIEILSERKNVRRTIVTLHP